MLLWFFLPSFHFDNPTECKSPGKRIGPVKFGPPSDVRLL